MDAILSVAAFPDGGGVRVLCCFCGCWHHHGGTSGIRGAHCRYELAEFVEDGERRGSYELDLVDYRTMKANCAKLPSDMLETARQAERIWRLLDDRRTRGALDKKGSGKTVSTAEYVDRLRKLIEKARITNRMELSLQRQEIHPA